jgi:hypothetical protein
MFRCQAVFWIMLSWSLIFAYTVLNYTKSSTIYQIIPIVGLFAVIIALNSLVIHAARQTKSILIFSTWCFFVLIAVLLRTLEIITDWHLNLVVAIFTAITAGVWCVAGHVEDVTESGLYWHVWSILSIFSILCAFNNDSQIAIIIYTVNTSILVLTHLLYVRHIVTTQTAGPTRCRHLFRTISCLIILGTLLLGSICYKLDDIDETSWQEWVIVVEGVLLLIIAIDCIIGFTHSRINGEYMMAYTEDDDIL